MSDSPRPLDRLIPFAVFAVSAAALGTAYVAQYVFGLAPCELCLAQRVPYALAGLIALGALFLPADGPAPTWVATISGGLFLIGSAIALYHVGVEQHWWTSVTACGGPPPVLTLDQLQAGMTKPAVVPCDQPAWTLGGISMAGYNAAASLILGTAALTMAWRLRR